MDLRPAADYIITVVYTEPGMEFGNRDLTCEEFIHQSLKYDCMYQLQCLPPDTLEEPGGPAENSIIVVDTEPGMEFGNRNLTYEEFIRHCLEYYCMHQLQCLLPDTVEEPNCFEENNRHKAFKVFMQNISCCVFNDSLCVNTDTLVDTPFFPHVNEAYFHRVFRPYLVTMLTRPLDSASYPLKTINEVPLKL